MNKQTFLELMKAPENISDADFVELETLVKANPYFQSGHCAIAYASRNLKKSSSTQKMSTAAIYSTNRNIFKHYILGKVKFAKPTKATATPTPTSQQPTTKTAATTSVAPRKAPTLNTDEEQSELIKEIYANLEKWKASREHYLEYDKKHPEEIVIEDPNTASTPTEKALDLNSPESETIAKPTSKLVEEPKTAELADEVKPAEPASEKNVVSDEVEKLKSQVAEEIQAEEESISKALSKIAKKDTQLKKSTSEQDPIPAVETEKKAESSIDIISSDELSAIVDAESAIEEDEKAEDTAEEIEGSIDSSKTATTEKPKEAIEETAPSPAEEISAKQETPDTSTPTISSDELSAIVDSESFIEDSSSDEETSDSTDKIEQSVEPTTIEVEEPEKEEPQAAIEIEELEDEIEEEENTIDSSSDKSTEDTEAELSQIDKEIQELKLTPGSSKTGKKFRLGVLKRGTKFTKEKVKKETKPAATTEKKAATKTTAKKTTTKKAATKTTKSTTKKAATTAKPATAKKASTAKKATPKKKAEPKTKATPKEKKEPSKKASPKFRMSASIGSKVTKKTTTKKTPKKDDDPSSEKKNLKK
ncbi:hypothetical protein N7E81_12340 [Reichenbachiella carrageenanivorans]|uniref:Uncharacterized protein n=1 Tax=Reichenbachiella carrageenanivorans TaxID=2979869 RepID=A0ABY6CZA5_9BACT|nr:hypothetical protein [Reichenbachiella carrageenanivorans]UXX78148.1 hypothetical protein N7E81_12340 [Reichenbachiella carrageenanivorans]